MTGKINLNQTGDAAAIQAARHNDLKKPDAKTPAAGETAVGNDRLQFSNQASKVGELVDRLKQLPDVRMEKVNQLRERISTGNYNPSSADIAGAILKQESE